MFGDSSQLLRICCVWLICDFCAIMCVLVYRIEWLVELVDCMTELIV